MGSEFLTDQEIRRFSDQIQLPEIGVRGQEKLKNSNVAVVGAGGLGASVLKYLAAIGIGKLGIIDYSMVEESNIHRQTIYGGNDLGKLKTIITKQHLQELFPLVEFNIINLQLIEENTVRILKPFNLVIDASNNEQTSLIINNACTRLNVNFIYGAVSGFKGIASSFNSKDKFTVQEIFVAKDNYFQKNSKIRNNGSIALTYGLIGNILALEVVKIITNSSKSLFGKVLMIDGMSYELNINLL